MTRRVVVTGLGATTPLGGDVATTWANAIAGKSGARLLKHEWANTLPVHFAAEVVVAAEERFGVKIPDDQVAELATVGDAVNFIVKASA